MLRTPMLRAQSSTIPFLQTFVPPQRLATAIPAASVIYIRRITHYNKVDEVEVISRDGVEVDRKFWAAGTREMVMDLTTTRVPPTTEGGETTSSVSIKTIYNGIARPMVARKPMEVVEGEDTLGTVKGPAGTIELDVEPDAEGRVSEFIYAFSDVDMVEKEDVEVEEMDELARNIGGIRLPFLK